MKLKINHFFIICFLAIGSSLSFADSDAPVHKFIIEDQKGFLKHDETKKTFAYAKILVDQDIIVMEILSPAWNFHGVETSPNQRTEQEKKRVENETQRFLNNPHKFFRFDPAGACTLTGQMYKLEQISTADKGQKEGTKNWRAFDVRGEMLFGCETNVKKFQVDLFSAFPRIKVIKAQVIINQEKVKIITLTPDKPVIPLNSGS